MGKASPIVKAIYKEHIHYFGEPSNSIRFGSEKSIEKEEYIPGLMDVFIWQSDEKTDVTTFSTIGMSDKPMINADFRAELHFAIRGYLSEDEISKVAKFLANVAVYPFIENIYLDWLHILSDPDLIPCFSKATSILFHPAFVKNGWDTIKTNNITVKLLNIVPITEEERLLIKKNGIHKLFDSFVKNKIDIFARR